MKNTDIHFLQEEVNILMSSGCNIPYFSFNGKKFLGKIVDVYDGDTCRVNVLLGKDIYQFSLRMYGYDCPEIKTRDLEEKKYASASKEILKTLILEKLVLVDCSEISEQDKYGRILARIYSKLEVPTNNNDICINDFMIENHLGYPYTGKTKQVFLKLKEDGYYKYENIQKLQIPKTIHYA